MKSTFRLFVIAGALAGAICATALDVAAQQPIFGCVKQGTGMLRIPNPNEGCKAQETALGFGDFPLLVALRAQVQQLQAAVADLQERVATLESCTTTIPECVGGGE